MKQLGSELQVDFFNRLFVLVSKETEIKRVHIQKLNQFLDWKTWNPLAINLEAVRTSLWIDLKESLCLDKQTQFYQSPPAPPPPKLPPPNPPKPLPPLPPDPCPPKPPP